MATDYVRLTLHDAAGRQIGSRMMRFSDQEDAKSRAAELAKDLIHSAFARKEVGTLAWKQDDAEMMKKQTVIMHDGAWGEW